MQKDEKKLASVNDQYKDAHIDRQRLSVLSYVQEIKYFDFLLMISEYWYCNSTAANDSKTSAIALIKSWIPASGSVRVQANHDNGPPMLPLYGLPTCQSQFISGIFLVEGWFVPIAFVILNTTVSFKTSAYCDRVANEGGFSQERTKRCLIIYLNGAVEVAFDHAASTNAFVTLLVPCRSRARASINNALVRPNCCDSSKSRRDGADH